MKIQVNTLAIEVTRRCNMQCEHCLRGDAQNVDISESILEEIAKTIHPASVVFTGGEPSLNVPAIERYFQLAEQYGNLPSSFYVATNGATSSEQMNALALTLMKVYPKMDEPECCEVNVSSDMFHEAFKKEDYSAILDGLPFFDPDGKKHSLNKDSLDWLLNTGRAAENELGCHGALPFSTNMDELVTDVYQDGVHFDMLYVAANGNVVDNCDSSYKDIDDKKNIICSVFDLAEKCRQYIEKPLFRTSA